MPELPEAETIVRSIRPLVLGQRITDVEFPQLLTDGALPPALARIFADSPSVFMETVCGSVVEKVERYGKNILFWLTRPGTNIQFSLVVHLGMTGRLTWKNTPVLQSKHTHLVLGLDSPGGWIHYEDIRQFGRIRLGGLPLDGLGRLGPEPLEISFQEFFGRLRRRHARLKSLLLDQRFLRGLGNIYADESLFLARLHPAVRASALGPKRALRLWQAIRQTLRLAIAAGGSSVANFVDGQGRSGYFQLDHHVYRRTGQPCSRCGCRIRKIQIAGRSSHFCPRCQSRPRSLAPYRLLRKA